MAMFTSFTVTLAVAFSVAVMVMVLEVEVSLLLDWVITGALSGFVVSLWVTVCPLSVAFTVTLPWARSYVSARADTGRLQTSSRAIMQDNVLLSFIGIQSPFMVCAAAHTRRDAVQISMFSL